MRVSADGLMLPKLTVSIGIAFFPEHGETAATVLRAADQALYAAKGAGRDRCAPGASSRRPLAGRLAAPGEW